MHTVLSKIIARVHQVHMMNVAQRQVQCQLLEQANRLGL